MIIHKILIITLVFYLTLSCHNQQKEKHRVARDGDLIYSQHSMIDTLNTLAEKAKPHFLSACEQYNNGHYQAALIEMYKALAIDTTPHMLNHTGLIFMRINKDSAIAYYKKSIDLNPEFYYPYNNLSMAFRNKGYLDSSIWISTVGIEKAKKSQDLWGFYLNRGITRTFNKQYELARVDLDSAKSLCPNPEFLKNFEDFYNAEFNTQSLIDLFKEN